MFLCCGYCYLVLLRPLTDVTPTDLVNGQDRRCVNLLTLITLSKSVYFPVARELMNTDSINIAVFKRRMCGWLLLVGPEPLLKFPYILNEGAKTQKILLPRQLCGIF